MGAEQGAEPPTNPLTLATDNNFQEQFHQYFAIPIPITPAI